MDTKTLNVLEYDKIIDKLSRYCDFSASKELAGAIQPSAYLDEARRLLAETTEARFLLSTRDLTIGGSHDIRGGADLAARGGILEPQALLDIRSTLIACRELKQALSAAAEEAPRLAEIAVGLPETRGLVTAVSKVLSERGEVLDSASPKLASVRREKKISHERLMSRLQKYITDSATTSMLQEAIITQRDGRYVIPLRAEFKGRIKSVVHDRSSSGATLFVEPLAVVELNNHIRELELAEHDEELRLLGERRSFINCQGTAVSAPPKGSQTGRKLKTGRSCACSRLAIHCWIPGGLCQSMCTSTPASLRWSSRDRTPAARPSA